eukprot:5309694-Prymnesium_polylepis.1
MSKTSRSDWRCAGGTSILRVRWCAPIQSSTCILQSVISASLRCRGLARRCSPIVLTRVRSRWSPPMFFIDMPPCSDDRFFR